MKLCKGKIGSKREGQYAIVRVPLVAQGKNITWYANESEARTAWDKEVKEIKRLRRNAAARDRN
jgi:hypothetical protein